MPRTETGKRGAGTAPPAVHHDLADRVRFDLETAGFCTSPPTDQAQGGLVVSVDQDDDVVVGWLSHTRLNTEALAMVNADHLEAEAVTRFETVRDAMNTALAAVLTGFGYDIRPNTDGLGHIANR
ncbi:hypothetical protein [Streptomyces sp. DSM 41634]|uniref:hypothetical protein n=1 Tax=Streptomyces sp. DSM 41634 TaxID=3448656 RepID=UPI002885B2D8|nr:hypothetical protein [Streptomyces sp. DSM 41633]